MTSRTGVGTKDKQGERNKNSYWPEAQDQKRRKKHKAFLRNAPHLKNIKATHKLFLRNRKQRRLNLKMQQQNSCILFQRNSLWVEKDLSVIDVP